MAEADFRLDNPSSITSTDPGYGTYTGTSIPRSTGSDPSTSLFEVSKSEIPEFVKDLPERYKCNICKEVAINSTQSECGHLFCKSCIEEYFDSNPDTTVCPTPDDDDCQHVTREGLFFDKGALREIKRQKIYCSNKSFGCPETMAWSDLGKHVTACTYIITCKCCGERIGKTQEISHLEDECPKVMIDCRYCSQKVLREKMDDHIHQDCPNEIKKCSYSRSGCSFKGTTEQLKQHEKGEMKSHLNLYNLFQAQQDLKITELRDQGLENKGDIDILKKNNENLQKEKMELKKQYEDNSKKMKNLQKLVADQGAKIITLECESVSKADFLSKSQEVDALKESQLQLTRRMNSADGGRGSQQSSRQFAQHDQQLVMHDVRLAEMDLRFQVLETTNYSGVLVWKIKDYTRRKQDARAGRTVSLDSQPFYTERYGYKMCARIHLDGCHEVKGSHVSLRFCLMKGERDPVLPWPFRHTVTLVYMSQDKTPHLSDTFIPDYQSGGQTSYPWSIRQHKIENESFIKEDTLFVKVVVGRHVDTPKSSVVELENHKLNH